MTLNEYQRGVISTKKAGGLQYTGLALAGEAGEVANEIKKLIRDGNSQLTHERQFDIAEELGDVLWYAASLADDLGMSLEHVAFLNQQKLAKRYADVKAVG